MKRKQVFRKLLRYCRPYAFLLVCSIFILLYFLRLSPYFAGKAVDCIVSEGNVNRAALLRNLIAVAAVSALATGFQWLLSLINNRIAYGILSSLRKDAFKKIEKLPLRYLDGRPYGDVTNTVINDAESVSEGLLLGFTQLYTAHDRGRARDHARRSLGDRARGILHHARLLFCGEIHRFAHV